MKSQFPVTFENTASRNRLLITVAGLLAHATSIMDSVFILRETEHHNDASRLTRSLYDHVANMAWVSAPPVNDHLDRFMKSDLKKRLKEDAIVRELGFSYLTAENRASMEAQVDALDKEMPDLKERAVTADAFWESRLDAGVLRGSGQLSSLKGMHAVMFSSNNGVVHGTYIGLNRVVVDEPGTRRRVEIQAPDAFQPYGIATAMYGIALLIAHEILGWPDPKAIYAIFEDTTE